MSNPTAAIYARFSTELQNERSTEDQIDLCRAFARRHGFTVVAPFEDKAISGASMHNRPGLQGLMRQALDGHFQAIIVESLDRLSRDMEDLAGLKKRLDFAGVKIVTVHEGEANTLTVGLRGLIGQLYREDNVHKVRRGMTGLIKQGLSAGGKAYGYRPDPANKGKPIIVAEEARIVRRIFEDYAAGVSPKAICRQLNADHVRPPRGRLWSPSALIGFSSRGTGMLRNPIYAGRITWNKVRMIKDPSTGKRVSRPNPPSEWQSVDAPDLRVIPNDLFEAVQAQLNARASSYRRDGIASQRRPQRLLSGLLKCGACGSGMAVAGVDKSGRTRLRCSAHTNSGACPDPKTFYLDAVEELVIDSMTKELASPELIQLYAKTYMETLHREAAQENQRREEIGNRLKAIERENARIAEFMIAGRGDPEAFEAKSRANTEERRRLREELASLPVGNKVVVHPASINSFADRLQKSAGYLRSARAKVEMTLARLDEMGELSRLLREVIEVVTLSKGEDGELMMYVTSRLTPFMREQGKAVKTGMSVGAATLVAEEGIEPPTRGL